MASLSQELLAELNTAISRHRLDSVAEGIRDNAAECYAMIAVGEEDYSMVGNMRFGGDPDLPLTMDWPVHPKKSEPTYCNFLAQINFAELPLLAARQELPQTGILYLFLRYMFSAAAPVILDGFYFDGSTSLLSRRHPPDGASWCHEDPISDLVHLAPQRIRAVPSVSLAGHRKAFRRDVEDRGGEVEEETSEMRRLELQQGLQREGQIGQLLGFADDEETNLYRKVAFGRLGKRRLIYSDYWETMEEYEANLQRLRGETVYKGLLKHMQAKRDGVEWITSNRDLIAAEAGEWQLLLRFDSNSAMRLNFGDGDSLYAFIRRDDLARKCFSNLAGEVTQS